MLEDIENPDDIDSLCHLCKSNASTYCKSTNIHRRYFCSDCAENITEQVKRHDVDDTTQHPYLDRCNKCDKWTHKQYIHFDTCKDCY